MLNKTLTFTGAALLAIAGLAFGSAVASDNVTTTPLSVTQETVLDGGHVRATYTYTNDKVNGGVSGNHGFGGALGLTDNITVSASSYYADSAQNKIGDVFVNVTVDGGELLGFTIRPALGISIPNGYNAVMPVASQVSSGSFDLQPALAIWDEDFIGPVGVGGQWVAVFHLDDNKNGFNFGDRQTGKVWASVKARDNVVLYGLAQADFVGAASGFAAFLGNTETVSVGGGTNVYLMNDRIRLSGEVLFPVHDAGVNQGRTFRVGLESTF